MSTSFAARSESLFAFVFRFGQKAFPLVACLSLSFSITVALEGSAQAQLFNSPVDQLPVSERVALKNGEPVVTGSQGKYVAKVLITAKTEQVWAVMTDYNNFSRFLPNIASSQITEAANSRKILEQVNTAQFLLVKVRSRVRTSIVENNQQQINFQLIDGNLQKLQGNWRLEPIAPYSGAPANQILLTQTVEVEPPSGLPKDVFYNVFKDTLGKTMAALRQEVNRRSQ